MISDSLEEEVSPEAEGAGSRSMSFCRGADGGEAEGRKVSGTAGTRGPAHLPNRALTGRSVAVGRVERCRGAARARPGGHGRRATCGRLPACARGAAAGAGAPHRRAHHQLVVWPVGVASHRERPAPPLDRLTATRFLPQHGVGRRARRGGGGRVPARRGGRAGAGGAVPAGRAACAPRSPRRRPPALAQSRPGNARPPFTGARARGAREAPAFADFFHIIFPLRFSFIKLSVARSEHPFCRRSVEPARMSRDRVLFSP